MVIVGKVPEAVGALKLVLLASIVKDSKLSPIFNAASNLEFDERQQNIYLLQQDPKDIAQLF